MIRMIGRAVPLSAAILLIAGCGTTGKVIKPNNSGYLATDSHGAVEQAKTDTAEKINLADYKSFALVTTGDSAFKQIKELGIFSEVLDIKDLQARIIEKNLQDKVPSLAANDRIGISNAGRNYQKFLWIHFDIEKRDDKKFVKLIATEAASSKDVFVAEREINTGVMALAYGIGAPNDQNMWYPLFNSLVAWLKSNSVA
ncbi:MAG: hypothetical protein JSS16_09820 [Proteobacteria bacterium]|uniref:hypothetical protein n=1 Tax=Rudaea sp. TaxID=2136325 RepID=UPI001DD9F12F|nr:hypothetical protein [Pseudomonadota bacterium]MBS0567567.1 hypothetical protein [Pseudomonadota bacterium]